MVEPLLGKNLAELQTVAAEVGLPRFAGKQLAEWLYVRRVTSFDDMTNISLKGREALRARYQIGRHAPIAQAQSVDGTIKYLFEVHIGETKQYIETVYLPEDDRATLCVSTQAGCKMGCRFCMTGTLGFHGQLSAAEILNQVFYLLSPLTSNLSPLTHNLSPLTNIVLMGEGEPMDNIDEVLRALDVLTADYGCAWSPKRITVSTVGVLDGLRRFLNESDCHLAISLHNPFAAERAAIMPAEKAWPMKEVISLLREYDWSHQRRVSFEYICWHGTNDTIKHAKELLRLLNGLECRINLIRFHAGVDKEFAASDERQMEWLRDYLSEHGITTTIRKSRGEDILAACGMLVNSLSHNP
ncbi:MAG: 23S rRNA (adenine(2503)-C(2))-methyltransferase RlmN [Paludibacteraceae bacterium]|nr:23S rRNA (adenine(2503)-C(2))-methyltransferase RlmN [Paludibacteraceae bacterium]